MDANFANFFTIANYAVEQRKKISQSFAHKTEAEQLMIFDIKQKIYSHIRVKSQKENDILKELKTNKPKYYDYIIFLLAIQIYNANATKKKYLAQVREARQEVSKTITLTRAIEVLLPLIDELRCAGATWEQIATTISVKQKKILNNRKVTTDYLKKVYSKLKKK